MTFRRIFRRPVYREKKATVRTYRCFCCYEAFSTRSFGALFCSLRCEEIDSTFRRAPLRDNYNQAGVRLSLAELTRGYNDNP